MNVNERAKGYDRKLMRDLRVIDADPATGRVTWELDVGDGYWGNMNGLFCFSLSLSLSLFFGYWIILADESRMSDYSTTP